MLKYEASYFSVQSRSENLQLSEKNSIFAECADPRAPLFKKIAWALIHVMRVEERMNRERDKLHAREYSCVCVLRADSIGAQQFKLLSLIFAV